MYDLQQLIVLNYKAAKKLERWLQEAKQLILQKHDRRKGTGNLFVADRYITSSIIDKLKKLYLSRNRLEEHEHALMNMSEVYETPELEPTLGTISLDIRLLLFTYPL